MKKLICIILITAFALSASSCQSNTPSGEPKDYAAILTAAQSDADKENFPVISSKTDETTKNMLDMTSLDEATIDIFAAAINIINVQVYAIMIIKPENKQANAVKDTLSSFVDAQKKSTENYLPDQFEIASNAILETMKSGEVVLVMCENADAIFESIKEALK